MKTITLDKPWDHITPQVTTCYPAGTHQVTNEVAEAAEKAGRIKEGKTDGSAGKPGAGGGTDETQK